MTSDCESMEPSLTVINPRYNTVSVSGDGGTSVMRTGKKNSCSVPKSASGNTIIQVSKDAPILRVKESTLPSISKIGLIPPQGLVSEDISRLRSTSILLYCVLAIYGQHCSVALNVSLYVRLAPTVGLLSTPTNIAFSKISPLRFSVPIFPNGPNR